MRFDPENDPAKGMNKARIKDGYEKALQRGDMDLAEEIRTADGLSEAQHLTRRMRDYDPLHERPTNVRKAKVKTLFETLRDLGHTDLAEDVRLTNDAGEQEARALEAIEEIDAEVDPISGEVTQEPGDEEKEREKPSA